MTNGRRTFLLCILAGIAAIAIALALGLVSIRFGPSNIGLGISPGLHDDPNAAPVIAFSEDKADIQNLSSRSEYTLYPGKGIGWELDCQRPLTIIRKGDATLFYDELRSPNGRRFMVQIELYFDQFSERYFRIGTLTFALPVRSNNDLCLAKTATYYVDDRPRRVLRFYRGRCDSPSGGIIQCGWDQNISRLRFAISDNGILFLSPLDGSGDPADYGSAWNP